MIRRFLTLATLFIASVFVANAQTTISASAITDSFGHPVVAAKLCFAPVDATGTATGFRNGATQVVSTPVCGLVSNGVLQSGLSVVPTPAGIYYHITTANRVTNAVMRDYGMTQITGGTWSLDSYDPSTAVLPVSAITMGTVTTVPPGTGASCTLSGSGPTLLNCSIPQGAPGTGSITGLSSDGASGIAVLGNIGAASVNGVVEASKYSSLATAIAATPSGGHLHVAAGTYAIPATGDWISNSITVTCEQGAVLQASASRTGAAITVSANNVTFDGCTVDGGNTLTGGAGTVEVQGNNFTFKNGALVNFADAGIRQDSGNNIQILNNTITMNTTVSGLPFRQVGGIQIYAPASTTLRGAVIDGNTVYGHIGVVVAGNAANGRLNNVRVTHNKVFPVNGGFGTEIGDFTTSSSGWMDSFLFTGNECVITNTTVSTPANGCFSSTSRVTNLVMGPNTYNAVGQYINVAIIELGAYNPVIGAQTINAGQDPTNTGSGGTQTYSAISYYNGGSFTGSKITGWGGLGSCYGDYAQGNGDNVTITGGSCTADSSVNGTVVGGQYSTGVRFYCNQDPVYLAVSGVGAGGSVTSVTLLYAIPNGGGVGSTAGGNFSAATGVATSNISGSGSGLTVNTSVNANGAVTAVTVNAAGSGYAVGNRVSITSPNPNYYGSSILNAEIGGGLSINGGVFRAFDMQTASGTNHCPVSAHISGVTINGAVTPTFTSGLGATSSLGDVQIKNVSNPAPVYAGGATSLGPNFPNGLGASSGSVFTPTSVGWYRIISASTAQLGGSFTVSVTGFNNHTANWTAYFNAGGYGASGGSIAVLNNAAYSGLNGPIDEIELSNNGSAGVYVDIHIPSITGAVPISISYSSGITGIISTPTTSTPGTQTALLNMSSLPAGSGVTNPGLILSNNAIGTAWCFNVNNGDCWTTDGSGNPQLIATFHGVTIKSGSWGSPAQFVGTDGTGLVCTSSSPGIVQCKLNPSNGIVLGASGSSFSAHYKGSGTLTYTSITAPGCQEQPLTITNAAAGDQCNASTGASDIGGGFYYGGCRISAANTAQVKVCATVTGTPSAVAWTGWATH